MPAVLPLVIRPEGSDLEAGVCAKCVPKHAGVMMSALVRAYSRAVCKTVPTVPLFCENLQYGFKVTPEGRWREAGRRGR